MTDNLRALLEDVAAGRVLPDVAAQQLTGETAEPDAPRVPPTPQTGAQPSVERIVISVAAGKVVIVGDSTVSTAQAQGPVVATTEGTTMRLDNRPIIDQGFRFERSRRGERPWLQLRNAFPSTETITVRVNPSIPVELSLAAGSAQVTGLRAGLMFRVDAGSLRAFDGAGRLEGRVASGSVQLDWLVRDGASTLRAELGSLKLRLLPGSDVTVSARTDMGSAELGPESVRSEDGRRRLTVGSGAATLDIDVDLGSVKVQSR